MGTTLTGTKPKDTYDSLIKVEDNGPISGTAKYLSDGLGNNLPIAVSTSNVGIGTSTPTFKLSVNGGYIQNTDGTRSALFGTDGIGALIGTNTNHYFRFITNDAERLRITDDGYVRLSSGSGGIQFNSDTAAANALDDYEEGNWTPTISFGGASVGITYATNNGFYTKIGNKVTTTCYILLTNKGSSTGAAKIEGLPFTVNASSRAYSAASLAALSAITSNGTLQAYGSTGGTTVELVSTSMLGVQIATDNTNFANNTQIIMTFTYFI